jgi:hypothetical protein
LLEDANTSAHSRFASVLRVFGVSATCSSPRKARYAETTMGRNHSISDPRGRSVATLACLVGGRWIAFASCGGVIDSLAVTPDGGSTEQADAAIPIDAGVVVDASKPFTPSTRACGTSCPTVVSNTNWPHQLVVDDGGVTWGEDGWNVLVSDFDGGNVRTIGRSDGVVNGLAVDTTTVYWGISEGALFRCPKTGCTPPPPSAPTDWPTVPLALGIGVGGLAIDATTIYFDNHDDGKLYACPLAEGCPSTPAAIVSGLRNAGALARWGARLYWLESLQGGTVNACDVAACRSTATAIAAGLDRPTSVIADDSGVYWTEIATARRPAMDGRVMGLAPGGAPIVLASGIAPGGLALDGRFVYFPNGDGWIMKCAKSGCGGIPTRIARGIVVDEEQPPSDIAVDDNSVYWTESWSPGAIVKARK